MTNPASTTETVRNAIVEMLHTKQLTRAARLVHDMDLSAAMAAPSGSVTAYERLTDRILAGEAVVPVTRGMTTEPRSYADLSPEERTAHDRAMDGMVALACRGPLSEQIAVTNSPELHTQARVEEAWAYIRGVQSGSFSA